MSSQLNFYMRYFAGERKLFWTKVLLRHAINRVRTNTVGMPPLPYFEHAKSFFAGKTGIEIGGPSLFFGSRQILPVYSLAKRIDGVNFSTQTVWENTITPGETYRYEADHVGYQHIAEASELTNIPDNTYDFLLSSHCLEHCANALKTLQEWKRVVKPGGALLVLVPDKRVIFDWKRETTPFSHLLADYERNTGEDDLTHADEFLANYDMARDAGAVDREQVAERTRNNLANRCLHHHVFSLELLGEAFAFTGITPIYTETAIPSLVILGQKQP